MNEFTVYTMKSAIAMAIFATAYYYGFRKEMHFAVRRFYLLIAVVLSLVLSAVTFDFGAASFTIPSVVLDEIDVYGNGLVSLNESTGIPVRMILDTIYFVVAGILLLRVTAQIINLLIKSRKYEKLIRKRIKVYRIPGQNISFSFFRRIFIGKTSNTEEEEKILEHEKIHANELHTIDVLILEILSCIFWFNPLIWWYRQEIKKVHEYLADEGVLAKGFSPKSYQITLLEHLVGTSTSSVTNNFHNSLIKNRIKMMNLLNHRKRNLWKIFLLIPVSLIIIFAFACQKEQVETDATDLEPVFFIVEEMPLFNNGEPAVEFRKYIADNLKYPEKAAEEGIEGRVIVQFGVNSRGEVVNAKVVKGVNPLLDAEALRVIRSSPQWTPGKQKGQKVTVLFTFPMNFVLDNASTEEENL